MVIDFIFSILICILSNCLAYVILCLVDCELSIEDEKYSKWNIIPYLDEKFF